MSKDKVQVANTFIDKGVILQAQKLSGSESVRIDGSFIGDIELSGYLQVGESGHIKGNLRIFYALVAGEIRGDIECQSTLHLSSKARIFGNITSERIIIDDGAIFHGFCETKTIAQLAEVKEEPTEDPVKINDRNNGMLI